MKQDYWHLRVDSAEKRGSRRASLRAGLSETAWIRMVVRRAIAEELGETPERLFNGAGEGE